MFVWAKTAIGEKDAKTGHKSTYNLSDKHPRRPGKVSSFFTMMVMTDE